jgi:hypothetical protein
MRWPMRVDRPKNVRLIRPQVFGPGVGRGPGTVPAEVFDEELWRARIGRWFPELVDPMARALTWPQIAAHHQWISDQLDVPVTVATIAQRLRDDHHVEVSETTVRRYIATTFTEQRLEDRVTVPRGAVDTTGLSCPSKQACRRSGAGHHWDLEPFLNGAARHSRNSVVKYRRASPPGGGHFELCGLHRALTAWFAQKARSPPYS